MEPVIETTLDQLEARLAACVPDPALADDPFVLITLRQAFAAAREGNAAVGAALVGPDGKLALAARNRMFRPYFRSDLHAEMELLTNYEEILKGDSTLKGYTLYSSLEPCEMCTIRIINSGVSHVRFAARDEGKGGITGPNKMAPHWERLAAAQTFAQARCSPEFAALGLEVFQLTIGGIVRKMMERR
jgi:tRNA(adenine34) deaminase